MSVVTHEQEQRRIIPRWRDSSVAVETGELTPVPERDPQDDLLGIDDEIARHVADWNEENSIGRAADLVSAAVVLDRPRAAERAAEFLLSNSQRAGEIAVQLARRVLSLGPGLLGATRHHESAGESAEVDAVRTTAGLNIRYLRTRLRGEPRNVIAWLDLSRQYTRLGLEVRATEAMRAALALAPNHRFTLRSATRFFLHRRDPERAYDLLRRSRATPSDPWLSASEIAVATLMGKTSRLMKPANGLLRGGKFSPYQISELASALATVEALSGRKKTARGLFALALDDPNENSVAQAHWVARHTGLIEFEESFLEVPRTFEARAWSAYAGKRWQEAVTAASEWLEDEPFAGRPADLAAGIAAVALEDGVTALRFARLATLANPASSRVRNNEVFALIHAGDLGRAADVHLSIEQHSLAPEDRVVWLANGGMLAYRLGDTVLGHKGYAAAVSGAVSLKMPTLEAAALSYWAAEALRAERSTRPSNPPMPDDPPRVEGAVDEPVEQLVRRAEAALTETGSVTPDLELAKLQLARAKAGAQRSQESR